MDSLEFNKVFAAVLVAGIAYVGLGIVADNAVHPERLAKSALDIKGAEPAATAAAPAAPVIPPIAPLLVKAEVGPGEALTKKICIACHNFNQGGANKVGPALYGVVGREQASAPGYTYSAALSSHKAKWTYEQLNQWLLKPAAYAPGTKMAYAGVTDNQIRADLIDYLRTLSPNPEPLPTPAEAAAAAAAATQTAAPPAGGQATPAGLPPLTPLLVKANPADGQALTKKICIACHNFNEGGANKVGPLLYGVVGRDQASAPGYTYSKALSSHHAKWTYAQLNEWLYKPSAYAPGTKMAYAGISNDQTRADVIDYLRTLSHDPMPLPAAGPEKASATVPAKPGEDTSKPGTAGNAVAPPATQQRTSGANGAAVKPAVKAPANTAPASPENLDSPAPAQAPKP